MRLAAAALLFTACSNAYTPDVDAPAEGFQLVTPEISVPAGQEQLWCSFFPAIDDDLVASKIEAFQAPGGHHAALFAVNTKKSEGTFRCDTDNSAIEMTGWRLLGAGDANLANGQPFPDGVGLRIPKGKSLMIQSHYVAANGPIVAHDVINVTKYSAATAPVLADFWAFGDTHIKVPKGASQATGVCNIKGTMNVSYLLGHTHQWGNLFRIELLRAGSETWEQKYYETDGVRMRADPPKQRYPLDAPLVLNAGDKIRYTCGWENTTDHVLEFPEEMCQGLVLYHPSQGGFLVCDGGGESDLIE